VSLLVLKMGLHAAELLSEVVKAFNWTRHCNAASVVRHLGSYFDLYNEGSIIFN